MALSKFMTADEYLRFERQSEIKHEYDNGEIFAMSGASTNHNVIMMSVGSNLYVQLRERPRIVYPSDMRVKTRSKIHYTYPDVSVVCEKPQFEDNTFDTLLNPTVIIEVLSPSTENYDRGKKFQSYRTIPSLQEYLLIAQDRFHIEHFVREGERWIFTDASTLDAVLTLGSIGCTLALRDVYEKVTFENKEGTS